MGHGRVLVNGIYWVRPPAPMRAIELGAGDGSLMLRLVRRLPTSFAGSTIELLDRCLSLSTGTAAQFAARGWKVVPVSEDVLEWGPRAPKDGYQLAIVNLFLHHFEEGELSKLLRYVGNCADSFVAVEPRRSRFALLASRMLWALGCSRVTRHDAAVSVRAGFAGKELTSMWPVGDGWEVRERSAGLWSHAFMARKEPGRA